MAGKAASTSGMSELRATLICALLAGMGPISMSLYTPAMPDIAQAFATSETLVGLSVSAYFAGFTAAQLIVGPLSDGFGRRPILIIFIGIYLAAAVVAMFAGSVETLITARIVQGIGAAAGLAVSRAIVRDLFEGEGAARMLVIMNCFVAIGPAIAPFLGGVALQIWSWQAIFVLMVVLGTLALVLSVSFLRETAPPTGKVPVRRLFGAYRTLLSSPYFMWASIIVAGSQGVIYAQMTVLSFILIERSGLTPDQFGLSMLMQTGSFMIGSLLMGPLLRRVQGQTLMPVGLLLCAVGCVALVLLATTFPPSVLTIMGPVAIFSFGIAFTLPTVTSATLTPFPQFAGAASALLSFMQMGAGLLGGLAAALFTDPVVAMTVVMPVMTATAIVSWLIWRRLEPPVFTSRTQPDIVLPA